MFTRAGADGADEKPGAGLLGVEQQERQAGNMISPERLAAEEQR